MDLRQRVVDRSQDALLVCQPELAIIVCVDGKAETMITRESDISFREIKKETLRSILNLKVSPAQEHFVATNAVSIAQAYFDREVAWFRAIYADETPVGFLMLHDDPEQHVYHLWRFMIDQRFQKFGFGARAIELLVEHVRKRPGATKLSLSCQAGAGGPGPFYEKMGFAYTGEIDEREHVMSRNL